MKTQETTGNKTIDYKIIETPTGGGEWIHIQYDLKEFKEQELDNREYIKEFIDKENNKFPDFEGITCGVKPNWYNLDIDSSINLGFSLNERLEANNYTHNRRLKVLDYIYFLNDKDNLKGDISFNYGCSAGDYIDYYKVEQLVEYKLIFNETYNYLNQGQQQDQSNNNIMLGLGLGLGLPLVMCGIILTLISLYNFIPKLKKDKEINKEK